MTAKNKNFCIDKNSGLINFDSAVIGWELETADQHVITANDLKTFDYQQDGNDIVCVWKGLPGNPEFEVTTIWREENDLFSGRISYQGAQNVTIEKIHFPVVEFPYSESGELIIPGGIGCVVRNLDQTIFKTGERTFWEYLNNGNMQFCAYLESGNGFYFDSRDNEGYIKTYEFSKKEEQKLVYRMVHLLSLKESEQDSYELPYPVSTRRFKGSWFEAAMIYRNWAIEQSWAVKKREEKMRDLAVWIWNRGRVNEVAPPIEKLQEDLQLPLALDWYWWHRNPYDTEYPRYLPPREGEDKFSATIERLAEKNILTQVYINGTLWDMDDISWEEGGSESVVIKRDGTPVNHIFNTYINHRLAFMCGTVQTFKNKITQIADELYNLGLRSLYLDVIGNHSNNACYHKDHDHDAGGGTYQIAGYRDLLKKLKEKHPDMLLSSESCPEMYMDVLDSGILLDASNERMGCFDYEPIPLFTAVYHEFFTLFGNYSCMDGIPPYDELWPQDGKWDKESKWHELCPDQFVFEFCRGLVWGLQPTVVNLRMNHVTGNDFQREYQFLLEAIKFYYQHRDFLLEGQMLNPGKLETETVEVKILSRMVFTKEGKHKISNRKSPAILHSVWQAPNGRKALVLVNFTREKADFSFNSEGYSLNGELPPLSLRLIELS